MTGKFDSSDKAEHRYYVLAVEDNPENIGLVEELLGDAKNSDNINLKGAKRMTLANELLEKETFDAVLLDLNLPDCHGFDTFSSVHCRFPKVPIIVLTGSVDEELATKAVKRVLKTICSKMSLHQGTLAMPVSLLFNGRG